MIQEQEQQRVRSAAVREEGRWCSIGLADKEEWRADNLKGVQGDLRVAVRVLW